MKNIFIYILLIFMFLFDINVFAKDLLITNAKLVIDSEIFRENMQTNTKLPIDYEANIHENISIYRTTYGRKEPIIIFFKDVDTDEIKFELDGLDYETYDAEGKWVTSGIFAPFSYLGMADIGGEDLTNDIRSPGSLTSVSENASDNFNPSSVFIANNRRHGITHAAISLAAAGNSIFAGTGSIVNLTGKYNSIVKETAFVLVQLGQQGTLNSGGSRAASLLQLRNGLEVANCNINSGRNCENSLIRAISNINNNSALSIYESDHLIPVIRGNIPLVISVERAVDIINVIELKNSFSKLDIILLGASEAWKVADTLAENNIKVMIDPHNNLPTSFETVDSSLKNIIILDEAEVDYAITNLSALGLQGVGTLTQHAGNAVGNGLDWNKSFAAITSTPARWFNIPLINNSLVIWDGDPLNITSTPVRMFINGEEQSLTSRQTLLRDRYNPNTNSDKLHKYR